MQLPGPLSRLYATFQVLIHETAKFGVVGALNFVVDTGLANFLHFGPPALGPLTSKGISTAIAATSSYFLNRHWTFRHRARTGLGREYRMFILLSIAGLAIAEACLGFSRYVLGLDSVLAFNVSANGFGLVFGMVFRFWAFKRWVFPPADAPGAEAVGPSESTELALDATLRTTV